MEINHVKMSTTKNLFHFWTSQNTTSSENGKEQVPTKNLNDNLYKVIIVSNYIFAFHKVERMEKGHT